VNKPQRFNDPEFLAAAVKFGLLKGTDGLPEAYALFGALLRNKIIDANRRRGMVDTGTMPGVTDALVALTPDELLRVKEAVSGVIPFGGSK